MQFNLGILLETGMNFSPHVSIYPANIASKICFVPLPRRRRNISVSMIPLHTQVTQFPNQFVMLHASPQIGTQVGQATTIVLTFRMADRTG